MSDNELLLQVSNDIALVKQAIMGNGVKGLSDRMVEVEEWVKRHPQSCPLGEHISETVDSLKERKTNGWTVVGIVSGILGIVGSLAVAILK